MWKDNQAFLGLNNNILKKALSKAKGMIDLIIKIHPNMPKYYNNLNKVIEIANNLPNLKIKINSANKKSKEIIPH